MEPEKIFQMNLQEDAKEDEEGSGSESVTEAG